MKIKPEELSANNYILIDHFNHMELVPFVQTYMKKRTVPIIIFYLFNLIFFTALVFVFAQSIVLKKITVGDGLAYISIGFLITLFLIPVHEFIHVLAYRWQGAEQTSYDMNLRKFYFLAVADKFVANKREFQFVALAPFVLITISLSILAFFSGPLFTISILTAIFIHANCCGGDFALLSYFSFHKNKTIVTYDDKDNKISYFYVKVA